jgi:lysophospholipase L1-like esterase
MLLKTLIFNSQLDFNQSCSLESDFVLMNFGFNDIQRNIYLHASNKWKEEINNLINKYIEIILTFKTKFEIIPIVSFIYPNPGSNAKGQNSMGSLEDRRIYTIEANSILKNLCSEKKILFFDIYNFITDENGIIKKSFTIDDIHLDYNNKFLREYLDNKIIELCKNNM